MISLSDIITKYSILMFFLSGILIFLLDIRELKSKNLKRETNLAKITGSVLIVLGIIFYIVKIFL
ncbi:MULTISPECIES: CLC_0170 family protein [unclassified Caldicellulosiruptor]|uniref:CLC_0170 family protein n=1 Tax=unclassified Caldicellulosiruptor TaxID=2622462 RepID=UPI000584B6F4|nr:MULTISPECIES: CLC_0170 family protein [unclassified Caldicellulosiruptor]